MNCSMYLRLSVPHKKLKGLQVWLPVSLQGSKDDVSMLLCRITPLCQPSRPRLHA